MTINEDITTTLREKYGLMMGVEAAADELKLAISTVNNMCQRRDLAAIKTKRKWLIPTQAVIDYLIDHLTVPAEKNPPPVHTIVNGRRKLIV